MTAIASSVAELGIGAYDGQSKIVEFGPAGQEERVGVRWRADMGGGVWMGEEKISIHMNDGYTMQVDGASSSFLWGYVNQPIGGNSGPTAGQFGQGSYGWNPNAIRHADAAFNAGLSMQEKIDTAAFAWNSGDVIKIATVWYPIDVGDRISNVIMPDDNIGCQITLPQTRRIFSTTGWVNSLITDCAKENLMPHLYATKFLDGRLDFITCRRRWVGVPA